MMSARPIILFPHGMSHTAVSAIARENPTIALSETCTPPEKNGSFPKSFCVKLAIGSRAMYTPAISHERYMSDQMEKVNPAGVIAVGYMLDISA